MIERLASSIGRNDEIVNIELAKEICTTENQTAIKEIILGFKGKDKSIASDCIKVLYEIAERKPELLETYVSDFIDSLSSKNNRLVWGSMSALVFLTPLQPEKVYARLPEILVAFRQGSIITVDKGVSVLAELAKFNNSYFENILPILLSHLETCRSKEIPQHAERMAVCFNKSNSDSFIAVLEKRYSELTNAQAQRLRRLIRILSPK